MVGPLAERLPAHEHQKARLAEPEAKLKDAGRKGGFGRPARELTEENLDYPDCRWPISPNNSIQVPKRIAKLIAERKAKLGASRKPLPLAAE